MIADTPVGDSNPNVITIIAIPSQGKLHSVVRPVPGWLPTAKIPCKFHATHCCNKGDDCNFAHLNLTAATRPHGCKTWTVKTPTQPLMKQCKASAGDGTFANNMATIASVGKAFAKPAAKSTACKLPLGAAPGIWTPIFNSHDHRHGPLSNEEWAAACSKVRQRTAPKITGPRYFAQCHDDQNDYAETDDDQDVDIVTAGILTATPSQGKLRSVVRPVPGWLPTAKVPCKFHMMQCCRRGDECNFAHLKPNCNNKTQERSQDVGAQNANASTHEVTQGIRWRWRFRDQHGNDDDDW